MTSEEFFAYLERVMDEQNVKPSQLLYIPGVYEAVSEYYNNDVIKLYNLEHETENDDA